MSMLGFGVSLVFRVPKPYLQFYCNLKPVEFHKARMPETRPAFLSPRFYGSKQYDRRHETCRRFATAIARGNSGEFPEPQGRRLLLKLP